MPLDNRRYLAQREAAKVPQQRANKGLPKGQQKAAPGARTMDQRR